MGCSLHAVRPLALKLGHHQLGTMPQSRRGRCLHKVVSGTIFLIVNVFRLTSREGYMTVSQDIRTQKETSTNKSILTRKKLTRDPAR